MAGTELGTGPSGAVASTDWVPLLVIAPMTGVGCEAVNTASAKRTKG